MLKRPRSIQHLVRRVNVNVLGLNKNKRRQFFSTQGQRLIITEPPLHVEIERPCTVLLLEDDSLYPSSWSDLMTSTIPSDFGMSCGTIEIPTDSQETFQDRVDYLKWSLLGIPDAMLIARGPIASWTAQLYLESFSLIGLVAVDPILMDRPRGSVEDQAILHLLDTLQSTMKKQDTELLRRVLNGEEGRRLKLEPGPCPLLFTVSMSEDIFVETTKHSSQRHESDESPFGPPSFLDISEASSATNENDLLVALSDWVDDHVL